VRREFLPRTELALVRWPFPPNPLFLSAVGRLFVPPERSDFLLEKKFELRLTIAKTKNATLLAFLVLLSLILKSYSEIIRLGLYLFIKRALETTLTEENAIAAAAIIGFKSQPVSGYKTPAATGIPRLL